MAQFDATEVLAAMKRRGFVPSAQSAFTDAEFIQSAAEVIESNLYPKMLKANTNHFIRTVDIPVVAGTAAYRVPDRAATNGVESIWMVNANGSILPIEQGDAATIPYIGLTTTPGTPCLYLIEGPNIRLFPTPAGSTGTLRVRYHIRANRLVAVASTGVISAVNQGANQVTVSLASKSGLFDFCRGRGLYETMAFDQVGTWATSTVTIPGGLPADVAIGDYVCGANECAIPQLPTGLHLAVALRAVAAIQGARGNRDLAGFLLKEAEVEEGQSLDALAPRNQTETQDFVNPWW
jgi:hypothetical protein